MKPNVKMATARLKSLRIGAGHDPSSGFDPEDLAKLCFHCKKIVILGTNLCPGGCKIARYCSEECRREALPGHEYFCEEIRKRRNVLPIVEAKLIKDWGAREALEARVGGYWGYLRARDFCRTRQSLALLLLEAAEAKDGYVHNPEGFLALKEAEMELLELLRLTYTDNQGARSILPFVLLLQGRLQDCFDMIHWWATIDPDGKFDWGALPKPAPKPGQWLYPRGNNVLNDLQKDKRSTSVSPGDDLNFLLALIAIKIIIIEQLESGTKKMEDFDQTLAGKKLPRSAVKDCIKEQKRQLRAYLVTLQKLNSFVLPGIANPEPMLAEDMPEKYGIASRDEAKIVVKIAAKACETLGVCKMIKQLLPGLPKYNPAFQQEKIARVLISPLSLFKGAMELVPGGTDGLTQGFRPSIPPEIRGQPCEFFIDLITADG